MAKISNAYLERLVRDADIAKVVGSHVALKKAGQKELVGLCCFHDEKTPSLHVNCDKGVFLCRGCGASGNALEFVSQFYNVEFRDAVHKLAELSGLGPVEFEQAAGSDAAKGPSFGLARQCLTLAASTYVKALGANREAITYLRDRGIVGEDVTRFMIGYAPNDWHFIEKSMTGKFGRTILKEAGLIASNETRQWDFFRHRIMLPIRNLRGEVVGFGGRTLPGDSTDKRKYMNSPEGPLFKKSQVLYGLYEAKQQRSCEPGVITVAEGYFDVISSVRAGFNNTVCTMGTAVTDDHIQLLFRHCDTIRFLFDGDRAGLQAAWKALEVVIPYLSATKSATFAILPAGLDPDEVIQQRGRASLQQVLQAARPASAFLFERLRLRHPDGSPEANAQLVSTAGALIQRVTDSDLRRLMLYEMNKVLGLSTASAVAVTGAGTDGGLLAQAAAEADDQGVLAKHIDQSQMKLLSQASNEVVALCGLLLREPAWLALVDEEERTGLSQADSELIRFAAHTVSHAARLDREPAAVYHSNLRYLVMYLQSGAPHDTPGQIGVVKAFHDWRLGLTDTAEKKSLPSMSD